MTTSRTVDEYNINVDATRASVAADKLDASLKSLYNLWNSGQFTMDPVDGNPYAGGVPVLFVPNAKGKFSIQTEVDFKNSIRALPASEILYYKKLLNSNGYNFPLNNQVDENFISQLTSLWKNYSLNNFALMRIATQKGAVNPESYKALSFIDYMKSGAVGAGGGPTSTVTKSISSAYQAGTLLEDTMQKLLGRRPTKAEKKDFLKQLNAKENAIYNTTTSSKGLTISKGSTFSAERFATQYVMGKADFKGDLGTGQLGDYQDSINQLAYDSGVEAFLTDSMRYKMIKGLANGSMTADSIRSQMNDLAEMAFPAWSQYLKKNPTMTLRDIASPYLSTYANMLDKDPSTVDLSKVLSMATGANAAPLSIYEFQKLVRKDPSFQMSTQAHNEAASLGQAFARMSGVNL